MSDARQVLDGLRGLGVMGLALLTPFHRERRSRWGLGAADGARTYPGDDLVPRPRWGWTHAIAIDAPAGDAWPWVAQMGADRAGFYSYTWLENLVGCGIRDAGRIHPGWEAREGDGLVLHPRMPPLRIVSVERGRHMVAHAPADADARAMGKPWAEASWLFLVEPLGPSRCRVVSRYRCAGSDDLRTRLSFGPTLLEPIGFAMDRRMLRGIRDRVTSASAPKGAQ